MFIVKYTDKISGKWSYQHKGLYQNMGTFDLFDESMCFKTEDEAMEHIKHTLVNPDCGRWRDDVDESCFSIVKVVPLKCLPHIFVPNDLVDQFCINH